MKRKLEVPVTVAVDHRIREYHRYYAAGLMRSVSGTYARNFSGVLNAQLRLLAEERIWYPEPLAKYPERDMCFIGGYAASDVLHWLKRKYKGIVVGLLRGNIFNKKNKSIKGHVDKIGGRAAVVSCIPALAEREEEKIYIVHEVAHLFGAEHVMDTSSYMFQLALDGARRFDPQSKEAITRFISRNYPVV